MAESQRSTPTSRPKDGRSWRIGGSAEVAWIADGTETGLTISAAIPPIFAAYATTLVPSEGAARTENDLALLGLLTARSGGQPWWLGYLDTGADDLVFADAPKVELYARWSYVLVEAGPGEAARWKDPQSWRGTLPDLIFPADRSWLVSTLWDDDWRCIGGPTELIEGCRRDALLRARPVELGVDATPPGSHAR